MSRVDVLSNSNQPRSTKTPFVVTYHPRSVEGPRDGMSAVMRLFPETCDTVKSNLSKRMRSRWICGDISSTFLELRIGTKGLWSVSTRNRFPIRKSDNLSAQVQVVARASFSICTYRRSVGVRARDFHLPSICFWVSTATKGYDDALADRVVSSVVSKIASAGAELGFSLTV